jgi:hypothetical protein
VQGGEPSYVAVVDDGELSYKGQVLITSRQAGLTERYLML